MALSIACARLCTSDDHNDDVSIIKLHNHIYFLFCFLAFEKPQNCKKLTANAHASHSNCVAACTRTQVLAIRVCRRRACVTTLRRAHTSEARAKRSPRATRRRRRRLDSRRARASTLHVRNAIVKSRRSSARRLTRSRVQPVRLLAAA